MEWTLEQVEEMRNGRKLYGDKQKGGALTWLRTSQDTCGEYSLLYFELGPGFSVAPHYHTSYTETFRILEGQLPGLYGKQEILAKPDDNVVFPPRTIHGWGPLLEGEVIAVAEVRPAHAGFEKWLVILHNMAADGLTNPDLKPKSLVHTALIIVASDIRLPGAGRLLNPVFKAVAWFARKAGVDLKLEEKYYRSSMLNA